MENSLYVFINEILGTLPLDKSTLIYLAQLWVVAVILLFSIGLSDGAEY